MTLIVFYMFNGHFTTSHPICKLSCPLFIFLLGGWLFFFLVSVLCSETSPLFVIYIYLESLRFFNVKFFLFYTVVYFFLSCFWILKYSKKSFHYSRIIRDSFIFSVSTCGFLFYI